MDRFHDSTIHWVGIKKFSFRTHFSIDTLFYGIHNSMPADMSYVQPYRMTKPCIFASTALPSLSLQNSQYIQLLSLKNELSFSSYPPVFASIGAIPIDTNMKSI